MLQINVKNNNVIVTKKGTRVSTEGEKIAGNDYIATFH
jgi:hypothetical protein